MSPGLVAAINGTLTDTIFCHIVTKISFRAVQAYHTSFCKVVSIVKYHNIICCRIGSICDILICAVSDTVTVGMNMIGI